MVRFISYVFGLCDRVRKHSPTALVFQCSHRFFMLRRQHLLTDQRNPLSTLSYMFAQDSFPRFGSRVYLSAHMQQLCASEGITVSDMTVSGLLPVVQHLLKES